MALKTAFRQSSLAAATLLFVAGIATAGDKENVEYRKNHMSVLGGHMGSLVAIVKGEVPFVEDLGYHADGLAAAAPRVIPVFKTEAMTDKSEALPEIWKDWPTFEKAALNLEKTSKALAVAAASGDQAAIGAALGDVGKSCKGCHDDFVKEH
ncbi:MAG: cytochrome c [Porticoccaceae bacterium]|nr:cytochrome c [Porticoccaceae bacterium]